MLLLHGATILTYFYINLYLNKRSIFSVKNSTLKLISGKNYSKLEIILEVNNAVVLETWMTKSCIADYTNTSLHGFAYFVLHPFFKRPLIVGKKSNLFYFLRSCLHPPSSTQCWFVNFFLSCALLRRYISSKVGSSFVEDIKMAAGFGGVCQYAGWLIFVFKVKSKTRFDILLGRGDGFMKNVAEMFSVLKLIYEWSLILVIL